MKHFKFSKLLLLFSLIIVLQNGSVIVPNPAASSDSYSGEESVAPCSDLVDQDARYD